MDDYIFKILICELINIKCQLRSLCKKIKIKIKMAKKTMSKSIYKLKTIYIRWTSWEQRTLSIGKRKIHVRKAYERLEIYVKSWMALEKEDLEVFNAAER